MCLFMFVCVTAAPHECRWRVRDRGRGARADVGAQGRGRGHHGRRGEMERETNYVGLLLKEHVY
jgi:hypothetical protein